MIKSKNDKAWEEIFAKYSILEKLLNDGRVSLSSEDINRFRESRLMVKFDCSSQLPKLFQEHKLSILPTSRGTYEIAKFETFHKFDEDSVEVRSFNLPHFLESIDYNNITNESIAINCAFASKILQEFSEEEYLLPTISGRMSSSIFDFDINSDQGRKLRISVNNSQIEIDGGYEGDNSLILIEAKNYISDDFLIRQLYYPYRTWIDKVRKRVRPVFLTYSNGIFHLREYNFTTPESYNSIRLVQYKKYIAHQDIEINIESIQNLLDSIHTIEEPKIPFPQADNFDRIINLCELLKRKGAICKEDITQNYGFTPRQTYYYSDAARYLGLLSLEQNVYRLTPDGSHIFNCSVAERQLEFTRLILRHLVFQDTLRLYLDKGNPPSKKEIVEIMKRRKLYQVKSEQTYQRRASTVISWINWILGLIK